MANISGILTTIKNAIYGKDMRNALHDGIKTVNDDVETQKNGLGANVRSVVLTGLSTATAAAISATDTVLNAFAKLQAQINTKEPTITGDTSSKYWSGIKTWRDFFTEVRKSTLMGLSTVNNTAIVATDELLVALGKLQAQINNRVSSSVRYTISPSNSLIRKADLLLTGTNDYEQISQFIANINLNRTGTKMGYVILEFEPGTIDLGANTLTSGFVNGKPSGIYGFILKFNGCKIMRTGEGNAIEASTCIIENNDADIAIVNSESFEGDLFYMRSALGQWAHAEGNNTIASGTSSHAEGNGAIASGVSSHAEGTWTEASNWNTHAEGTATIASGSDSHAEGSQTNAIGDISHAEGHQSIASGWCSHVEGDQSKASGDGAHAEGQRSVASGQYSHAEGSDSHAKGLFSHAEGASTATGTASHAEGFVCDSDLDYSHSEGYLSKAKGITSHAEGNSTIASGTSSHAEGYQTKSVGIYSHAEGGATEANGKSSHSEGNLTKANGQYSHSEGSGSVATGEASHAEGINTQANEAYSHAEGGGTIASGKFSHAEGHSVSAEGWASHAEGENTNAVGYAQHVQGQFNILSTASKTSFDITKEAYIIGNGTSTVNRGNAFKINFDGSTFSDGAYSSTGADYAEMFEWIDKNKLNEDRIGYFVTLNGLKIRKANLNDPYILGVVSGTAGVIGDSYEDRWAGKYVVDEWGRPVYETVQVSEVVTPVEHPAITIPKVKLDEDGKEMIDDENNPIMEDVVIEEAWVENIITQLAGVEKHLKLNPDYDPNTPYISRNDRPEWSCVGVMGKLYVRDDGTCETNGYCKPNNDGIATTSETGYRVLERVSDNVIRVWFK